MGFVEIKGEIGICLSLIGWGDGDWK